MKSLLSILSLLGVVTSAALVAAEKNAPVPPAATDPAKNPIAGNYTGTWQSSSGANGKLRLTLKPHGSGWGAEASFSFEGVEATTKMKSVKVDGTKLELEFEWELRGDPGESKLTGELSGEKLSGTYQSKSGSEPTHGTWTVTRS
jgi:hypothetical protein